MYVVRVLVVFSFLVLQPLFASPALADNFVECFSCTDVERLDKANSWAVRNISEAEANNNITKHVHIVDIYNNVIRTFEVSLNLTPLPPPQSLEYLPNSVIVPTPQNIQEPMSRLKAARKVLKSSIDKLVIPTSEIADAWQFTKCAFCENNVERFINNSLAGEIESVQLSIIKLAEVAGLVSTGIPNTYKVKLEAGGYLEVLMTINNQPITLNITVTASVDPDGNTVPFNSDQLRHLMVQISNINRAARINNFIYRFNVTVPKKIGYVVIKDCPKTKHDVPIPCGQ